MFNNIEEHYLGVILMLIKIFIDGADILWQWWYVLWKSQCAGWGIEKASKSWWEIILFWRFLQHLSKTLELITLFIYLFIYLIFDRTGWAVKWFLDNGRGGVVELRAWPIFTRAGIQDLLNLGERRKAIRPSESHRGWRGKEWFLHLCAWPSFFFFLSHFCQWDESIVRQQGWNGSAVSERVSKVK